MAFLTLVTILVLVKTANGICLRNKEDTALIINEEKVNYEGSENNNKELERKWFKGELRETENDYGLFTAGMMRLSRARFRGTTETKKKYKLVYSGFKDCDFNPYKVFGLEGVDWCTFIPGVNKTGQMVEFYQKFLTRETDKVEPIAFGNGLDWLYFGGSVGGYPFLMGNSSALVGTTGVSTPFCMRNANEPSRYLISETPVRGTCCMRTESAVPIWMNGILDAGHGTVFLNGRTEGVLIKEYGMKEPCEGLREVWRRTKAVDTPNEGGIEKRQEMRNFFRNAFGGECTKVDWNKTKKASCQMGIDCWLLNQEGETNGTEAPEPTKIGTTRMPVESLSLSEEDINWVKSRGNSNQEIGLFDGLGIAAFAVGMAMIVILVIRVALKCFYYKRNSNGEKFSLEVVGA